MKRVRNDNAPAAKRVAVNAIMDGDWVDVDRVAVLYKTHPHVLATRLEDGASALASVLDQHASHPAVPDMIAVAPEDAFRCSPDARCAELLVQEDYACAPFVAVFCGAALSAKDQDLVSERTRELPRAVWRAMAAALVDRHMFEDRACDAFSSGYVKRIFEEAHYTAAEFDAIAERMVDLEYGYFLAQCSYDLYDYIRSRSASYQERDVCDWDTVDDEGDGLECLPLYRRMRARIESNE